MRCTPPLVYWSRGIKTMTNEDDSVPALGCLPTLLSQKADRQTDRTLERWDRGRQSVSGTLQGTATACVAPCYPVQSLLLTGVRASTMMRFTTTDVKISFTSKRQIFCRDMSSQRGEKKFLMLSALPHKFNRFELVGFICT